MISDLHAAIVNHWYGNNLDEAFVAYREGSDATGQEFLTLNDTEAASATPMPYCVYELGTPVVISRMSDGESTKSQIRDIDLVFTIQAKQTTNNSAKEIASALSEEVMKVFGGHYSESPTKPEPTRGGVLILQYQSDYPTRTDDTNYSWTISYLVRMETTVAV